MSIGVGTLKPKSRIMPPVWLAGLLGFALALSLAVIVANYEEPAGGSATTLSRTLVNTPTELRYAGSAINGTAANTPTELRGGVVGSFAGTTAAVVPHVPRRGVEAPTFASSFGGTTANTPTELSGGLLAPTDLTYVRMVVNGELFWRLVP